MLQKMSLKAKILSGFMIVCFGLSIVAGTGYYALEEVINTYGKLANISVPNLGHVSGMRNRGRQIHAESIKLALYIDQPEETKKALESLNAALKRYDEIALEKLQETTVEGEDKVYKVIEEKFVPVKVTAKKIIEIFNSDDSEKLLSLKSLLISFEDAVREHQSSLLQLDDFHVETGSRWQQESNDLSQKMKIILIAVSIGTLVFALFLAFTISRNINSILLNVADRLKSTSEKVATSSEQVSKASISLTEGTTEQAEALHETVASTNEIAAMTEKTSDNARESLKRAELSQSASAKSQESLEQMLRAISEIGDSNKAINTQINKGNEGIQEIADLILEIGQKTKLIDDIVFQTKLLSFNVSVEAARAGEHGKGFAVVAQEMSNLADMSGRASKEISEMLNETTQKALNIIEGNRTNVDKLIEVGNQKLHSGITVANLCKEALSEIVFYVDEMCTMIKETSHSTHEQARGVAEINKAMGQIDTVTAQNTHASKQCSEAAVFLMSEVEKTREVIVHLLQVINGNKRETGVSSDSDFAA